MTDPGLGGLLDARPLKLISYWLTPGRRRAKSLYWHLIDSKECLCKTPHGNCWAWGCPCPRHEGEINR